MVRGQKKQPVHDAEEKGCLQRDNGPADSVLVTTGAKHIQ